MTIVKLIDSSNEKILSKYKNFSGPLVFVTGCIFIMDIERLKNGLPQRGFHTTIIIGCIKLSEAIIVFETFNGEYTFEIIDGKIDLSDGFIDEIIEGNFKMYKEEILND
jgi:hypothetical protein